MALTEQHIQQLFQGYLEKNLSDKDKTLFFQAISLDESLLQRLTEQLPSSFTSEMSLDNNTRQYILDAILTAEKQLDTIPLAVPEVKARRIPLFHSGWLRYPTSQVLRWASAAAILLLFGTGAYLWNTNHKKQSLQAVNPPIAQNDALPGSDKAILTLSNGKRIELNPNAMQTITDGQLAISNTNGTLAYEQSDVVVYNTMTTPKGGQYKLTLPDGTKVWLNAASSINYPTAFTGSDRIVSITGEAYFEVAKNAKMPFKVKINKNAEVEVLGTHFNINAYEDEKSINTTLLEGSVRLNAFKHLQTLTPGEQIQLDIQGNMKTLKNVDIDKVIAWKNGVFNFEDATLEEVMRQLERWYNIDVVYEKGIPNILFGGKISRNMKLSNLIKTLEKSEVHFRIEENKRLIVEP